MITHDVISAEQANEILQGGGLNWVLFYGDEFEIGTFCEWLDIDPGEHLDFWQEAKAVQDELGRMCEGEALAINWEE